MSGKDTAAPVATGARGNSTGSTSQPTHATAARKWQRVLRSLLAGPKTSRQLETECYDHCSHSTIAELRRKGVRIHSDLVKIQGYAGLPAYIARWTIEPESLAVAWRLLERS